jgi:hypothetical protein
VEDRIRTRLMKIGKIDTYKTIQVLALACLVVWFISKKQGWAYAAVILLILPLVFYRAAHLIARIWLKFSHILGAINSRIILSAIFFVVLTPLALIYKLMGNKIYSKPKGESYFTDRDHKYSARDLEKSW